MHWKLAPVFLLALAGATPAVAAPYPFSGTWTFENASEKGPAPSCGRRYMEFRGEQRFDHGGSVPEYRNRGWEKRGAEYRIADEFFNGQIRGRVEFRLREIDPDHLGYEMAGKSALLRRCG